ncbi:MAG: hypothetical protein ACM3SQ_14160 [Betaproteobacteria bacterium]
MNRSAAPRHAALGLIVLAVGFLAVTASDAWAYIDPGTGSYLFQIAAAGLLAGVYTMRRYWFALMNVLRRRPSVAGGEPPAGRANDMD